MDILERVIAIRTGGATERCHGIRHNGSYSVAAHTWGVLVLLYALWPEDYWRLSDFVMFHDVPEAWVGDIPATTKRYSREISNVCYDLESKILRRLELPNADDLPKEDLIKVKACDRLELYLWAKEEVSSGNIHASCIIRQLEQFFSETPLPLKAQELLLKIRMNSVEHKTDGWIKEFVG